MGTLQLARVLREEGEPCPMVVEVPRTGAEEIGGIE
jgi:hypothetical protein